MFSMLLIHVSYRNTRESLGELEKSCGNTRLLAPVPKAFLVLPNIHLCFYNSLKTRYIILF